MLSFRIAWFRPRLAPTSARSLALLPPGRYTIGATVLPRCRIGAGCTIGAGAVVIADVPDGATAVGVPASLLPPTFPGQRHNRQLLVNR